MTASGDQRSFRVVRASLVEYTAVDDPLALYFDFNPATLTRTRGVNIRTGGAPGTAGGYDFADRSETPRVSQGVTAQPETLSAKILLDATDRMNAGDREAARLGVQPAIDVLRMMVEPKSQSGEGVRTLAALGEGSARAFSRQQFASVIEFRWGDISLPVFITQVQVQTKEHLPNLYPYRAEVTLTMQVIESKNEIYTTELQRQVACAARHSNDGTLQ